jgi:hypothetical protein
LINIAEDEELFFAAVNQINHGGPTAVLEPSQKNVFAQLNLKAGKRAIELSDYNTAFTLFQHGISFLGDDDWKSYYQLSLDLYDAVAEAALILNKLADVTTYTDIVVLNARCFDDKLHCKYTDLGSPAIKFCVIQHSSTLRISLNNSYRLDHCHSSSWSCLSARAVY